MSIDTQLTTLFCLIHDFCTDLQSRLSDNSRLWQDETSASKSICASEVITLLLWFHLTGSRNFKALFAALTLCCFGACQMDISLGFSKF